MSTDGSGPKGSSEVHESITKLLAAYPGSADPKQLIQRLAREKVVYAKAKGWEGPPFCPKHFASIFGVRCKEVEHDIGGDGRILACRDGKPQIEYRSGRMLERQRFTIFHEFAHMLFPDYCEFVQLNHTPHKKAPNPEKKFEYLCDVAAAEMLMPIDDFKSDMRFSQWFGLETVHRLRERYLASIDATVYRLMDLIESVACAAAFLTDQKGDYTGSGPLWVNNFSKNKLFKGYVPSGTPIPRSSVATNCYNSALEISEPKKETWWINQQPRSWLVQAIRLPKIAETPNYPKVAALLFPPSYAQFWPRG